MKESIERVMDLSADIIRFNPYQPISSYLKPEGRIKILTTDFHSKSMEVGKADIKLISPHGSLLTSSPKHESILAEFRASICYILLTISISSEAMMVHDWRNYEIPTYRKKLLELNGDFFITLVGGMKDRGKNELLTMKSIEDSLGDVTEIHRLLINDKNQPVVMTSAMNKPLDDSFHGPSAVIFIPQSLAVNNKNTVLCIGPDFDESDQASRMLMSCGSKWEHFDVATK